MNVTVMHMQVTLDQDRNCYSIQGYRPGEITVTIPFSRAENVIPLHGDQPASRQEVIRTNVIIFPDRLIRDWSPAATNALTKQDLALLLKAKPEVLLLGTGSRLVWPSLEIQAAFATSGIGLEVMDTGAACRTYNILMSDQRRVAAALILDL